MSDEDVVDEIVVTGQRTKASSPWGIDFPSAPSSGPGGPLPPQDDEVEVSDESVQCAINEGRKQWNADGKAISSIGRFYDEVFFRHGERGLYNREMGALICEMPSGEIGLGPIESGEPFLDENGRQIIYRDADGNVRNPGVHIDPTGCGAGRPIGYIHTHPGVGAGVPSEGDFNFGQYLVDYNGAPQDVGIYTVATYQSPYDGAYFDRVTRAGLEDREAARNAMTFQPHWVNPNAASCPGDP